MRAAAPGGGKQTSPQIPGSLGTTATDLRRAGPEVRGDILRQSEQLAQQVQARTQPVHDHLARSTQEASASIGQATSTGGQAIDQVGVSVSAGLTQLLQTV